MGMEETGKVVTWNDVVNATIEAEANRVERTQSFDKIRVELTAEERAELGAKHVATDRELVALTDDRKEAMAAFKARIAKVESRKREIAEAIDAKTEWRTPGSDGWICEETFATNTRRYLDPKTGRVLCTEAMDASDRQLALPVVSEEAKPTADAQLNLGDVEPSDLESTDMTDPAALLDAAQRGEDADEEDESDDLDEDESDL
jgi:hypothetical protein